MIYDDITSYEYTLLMDCVGGNNTMYDEELPDIRNSDNKGQTKILMAFLLAISCIASLAIYLRQFEPGLN